MSGYSLFFRCRPGFTKPFPFERFDGFSDESLDSALKSCAREQLQSTEVQEQIRSIARKRRREYLEIIRRP
jgi:hypothetical protein